MAKTVKFSRDEIRDNEAKAAVAAALTRLEAKKEAKVKEEAAAEEREAQLRAAQLKAAQAREDEETKAVVAEMAARHKRRLEKLEQEHQQELTDARNKRIKAEEAEEAKNKAVVIPTDPRALKDLKNEVIKAKSASLAWLLVWLVPIGAAMALAMAVLLCVIVCTCTLHVLGKVSTYEIQLLIYKKRQKA